LAILLRIEFFRHSTFRTAKCTVLVNTSGTLFARNEVASNFGEGQDLGAEFLFQVIAERAEKAAVIVTTNLPFSEWTQVIPNPRLCKALLDRITDRAHIIETGTDSYRFRRTLEGGKKKKAS
jgi:hypothetical protein